MESIVLKLIQSWKMKEDTVNSVPEILQWINQINLNTDVTIRRSCLKDDKFWYYSEAEGAITNTNNSFFKIMGLQKIIDEKIVYEQPIIVQDEIGFLGIIAKEIDGILYFLLQAKIEPGNINKVQLSPTIQATKSNFKCKHGGKKPAYLEYFLNSNEHRVIVDQIQSEQSSRFYKKRNRNIVILLEEEIEIKNNYKWMTLGQIKELLKIDNLVNMDTRTVLSCLPLSGMGNIEGDYENKLKKFYEDTSLFNSMFNNSDINGSIIEIFNYINTYKMFDESKYILCPLSELKKWKLKNDEFICEENALFKIIFCSIVMQGREVNEWSQPLIEPINRGILGLIISRIGDKKYFLVHALPEMGCFDKIELAPTVQFDSMNLKQMNEIEELFLKNMHDKCKYDVVLSEEGGRFYHDQNRNIILEIEKEGICHLPKGYFWVDYKTINYLAQINNCLNIQLRNLLSLLEI